MLVYQRAIRRTITSKIYCKIHLARAYGDMYWYIYWDCKMTSVEWDSMVTKNIGILWVF